MKKTKVRNRFETLNFNRNSFFCINLFSSLLSSLSSFFSFCTSYIPLPSSFLRFFTSHLPLPTSLFLLFFIISASAATLDLTTYHPSPFGNYGAIRLIPSDKFDVADPCNNGTIFVSQSNGDALYVCENNIWVTGGSEVWEETAGNIYIKDQTDPELKMVGIGTSTPLFKLNLGSSDAVASPPDGGIIADSLELHLTNLTDSFLYFDQSNNTIVFGYNTIVYTHPIYPVKNSVNGGGESNELGYFFDDPEFGTMIGGKNNINYGFFGTISGGEGNELKSGKGFIGGGLNQRSAGSWFGGILGGEDNDINIWTIVGGGKNNKGRADGSAGWGILGGQSNRILTGPVPYVLTMAGGGGVGESHSAIMGGESNKLYDALSSIGSGRDNFIGYQFMDTPQGPATKHNHISGGESNRITDNFNSSIGGGYQNSIDTSSKNILIGGGKSNTISSTTYNLSDNSTIVGGQSNSIAYGFVGGGFTNSGTATIEAAIIGGNTNQGYVLGGQLNNGQSGGLAAGGSNNMVGTVGKGTYSYAAGRYMYPRENRTFAWGYANAITLIAVSDSFIIYPNAGAGKVGINTTNPLQALHVVGQTFIENGTMYVNLPAVGTTNPAKWSGGTATKEIGYDLAEHFSASETVSAGDVLIIDDKEKIVKLSKSTQAYDQKVVGIASQAPALTFEEGQITTLNTENTFTEGDKPPVALAGRVKCKVSLENGPIDYGTPLTTSSTTGHAMAATDNEKSFNAVFAKALEPFSGGPNGEQTGMISVLVNKQ